MVALVKTVKYYLKDLFINIFVNKPNIFRRQNTKGEIRYINNVIRLN